MNQLLSGLETQADLSTRLAVKADLSALQNTQAQVAVAQTGLNALQAQMAPTSARRSCPKLR